MSFDAPMSASSPAVEGPASPSALTSAEQKKLLEEWKRVAGQLFLACREAATLVARTAKSSLGIPPLNGSTAGRKAKQSATLFSIS